MYSLRPGDPMEAFLVSTSLVALAEMGDKTQLLSLLLATRFRRPWPIALGILVATLVNHTLAAALGSSLREWVGEQMLRFVVAAGFLGMAAWVLIPDKLDARSTPRGSHGVFATTAIAFFVAEMGDKTQIVTAALGARYSALFVVVLGTTFGMLPTCRSSSSASDSARGFRCGCCAPSQPRVACCLAHWSTSRESARGSSSSIEPRVRRRGATSLRIARHEPAIGDTTAPWATIADRAERRDTTLREVKKRGHGR
jgi:putative Ca2+/H+ antiporter (TMEM165/GDT1 family)